MKSIYALAFLLTAALAAPQAHARHVSYLGGTSVMSTNRPDWSELMAGYTLRPRLAPAIHYRVYRAEDLHYVLPTLNALALRWNEDASQTNLYLLAGAGIETRTNDTALMLAADGDYETRRFYSQLRYEALGIARSQPKVLARARVGFAPFLSEMEALHGWIILQAEHESRTARVDWTPMIRLTYSSLLVEFGYSQLGNWNFNWSAEF